MTTFNTIEHRIAAGGQFTGADPATTPTVVLGVETWPADLVGGLFDFEFSQTGRSWVVTRITADFNGTAIKGIYLRDRRGLNADVPIWESTAALERFRHISPPDQIVILSDEVLVVTSGICAAEMVVRVTAQPGLPIPAGRDS